MRGGCICLALEVKRCICLLDLLSHLNVGALPPAKVEKKTNSFVKVVKEEPKVIESSLVIKKGSLTIEINKLMNNTDLISLIKAIGECNVL